jgi:hypothetical protein
MDPAQAASTYGLKSYIIQNLAGTLSQGVVLAAGFAYFGSRAAAAHRKAETAIQGMMQSAKSSAKPGKRA